ncbi:hypothetical protein AAD001_04520 [Colwelliaceae bacterium 6471]
MKIIVVCLLSIFGLFACGGSNSNSGNHQDNVPVNTVPDNNVNEISSELAIPNNQNVDSYKILFYGNSHITHLSAPLGMMFQQGKPDKQVMISSSLSLQYLAERLENDADVARLTGENWTHVIFQAQKYSQSGSFKYPTIAAETWVKKAKAQNATPIMFPEHPQRGRVKEARMVHYIHLTIATNEASCVAPVGLAWDLALSLKPDLAMHDADGNHASALGKVLTAMVFYQVITGESADLLPYIAGLSADQETQDFFGQVASQAIQENIACDF